MYFDNALPAAEHEQLTLLEDTRARLLETMFSLRCACADVFADPFRAEERDGAAWELARAVGDIHRCDEQLHALREVDRLSRPGEGGRLIGSGLAQ
ncbi:hypothetical protein [Arthrobacter sp. N1]|uniref:hypothetical protein n=1 Tax=Arthrobacter sp. N1 TaxID=619291 RepID=UPI003BB16E5F